MPSTGSPQWPFAAGFITSKDQELSISNKSFQILDTADCGNVSLICLNSAHCINPTLSGSFWDLTPNQTKDNLSKSLVWLHREGPASLICQRPLVLALKVTYPKKSLRPQSAGSWNQTAVQTNRQNFSKLPS